MNLKSDIPLSEQELLSVLKLRFEKHLQRHPSIDWASVQSRLLSSPGKLQSLSEMERTGGEPDVIGYDQEKDAYLFCDCAAETPNGRRSLCYDREALDSRRENKPDGSAEDMAGSMGIELLTEKQYYDLQKLGTFDTKTSSWLKTPTEVRKLGGAIFGDRRYNRVFIYHNGASSYYAARGFRGLLSV